MKIRRLEDWLVFPKINKTGKQYIKRLSTFDKTSQFQTYPSNLSESYDFRLNSKLIENRFIFIRILPNIPQVWSCIISTDITLDLIRSLIGSTSISPGTNQLILASETSTCKDEVESPASVQRSGYIRCIISDWIQPRMVVHTWKLVINCEILTQILRINFHRYPSKKPVKKAV